MYGMIHGLKMINFGMELTCNMNEDWL